MNELLDILKYVLPSLIVLATSYYLLKIFLENEQKKRSVDIKMAGYKIITPIRLQAYERLVLFLERISPESLVMRVHKTDLTAIQMQALLLQNVREEFEHNLSQQVYVSSQAWELIKTAKEDTIKLINTASTKINDNATSTELSQKVFELSLTENRSVTKSALEFLKNEIRLLF
ncbi:MAG TPA: hypothetical protein PKK00_11955 [Bacteroidales bacterium]|nr:hypothetical protein [Bacteroidales bacterium]HPS17964.1 hypothetical protein [Bacteroidales bacterium]